MERSDGGRISKVVRQSNHTLCMTWAPYSRFAPQGLSWYKKGYCHYVYVVSRHITSIVRGLRDFPFYYVMSFEPMSLSWHAPELQSPIQSLQPLPGNVAENLQTKQMPPCMTSSVVDAASSKPCGRCWQPQSMILPSCRATRPPGPQLENDRIFLENKMNMSRLRLKLVVY